MAQSIEEARQSVQTARSLLAEKKAQAEQVQSQLNEQEQALPSTTSQQALRQRFKGIQGRIQRRNIDEQRGVIQEQQGYVKSYRDELGNYENEINATEAQINDYERRWEEAQSNAREDAKAELEAYQREFEAANPGEKLIIDWSRLRVKGVSSGSLLQSMPVDEYNKKVDELNNQLDRTLTGNQIESINTDLSRNNRIVYTSNKNIQGGLFASVSASENISDNRTYEKMPEWKPNIHQPLQSISYLAEKGIEKISPRAANLTRQGDTALRNIPIVNASANAILPYAEAATSSALFFPTMPTRTTGIIDDAGKLFTRSPAYAEYTSFKNVATKGANVIDNVAGPEKTRNTVNPIDVRRELRLDAKAAEIRQNPFFRTTSKALSRVRELPGQTVGTARRVANNIWDDARYYSNLAKDRVTGVLRQRYGFLSSEGRNLNPREARQYSKFNRPGGFLGEVRNPFYSRFMGSARRGANKVYDVVSGKVTNLANKAVGRYREEYGFLSSTGRNLNPREKIQYSKFDRPGGFIGEVRNPLSSRVAGKIRREGNEVFDWVTGKIINGYSKRFGSPRNLNPYEKQVWNRFDRPGGFIGEVRNPLSSRVEDSIKRGARESVNWITGKVEHIGNIGTGRLGQKASQIKDSFIEDYNKFITPIRKTKNVAVWNIKGKYWRARDKTLDIFGKIDKATGTGDISREGGYLGYPRANRWPITSKLIKGTEKSINWFTGKVENIGNKAAGRINQAKDTFDIWGRVLNPRSLYSRRMAKINKLKPSDSIYYFGSTPKEDVSYTVYKIQPTFYDKPFTEIKSSRQILVMEKPSPSLWEGTGMYEKTNEFIAPTPKQTSNTLFDSSLFRGAGLNDYSQPKPKVTQSDNILNLGRDSFKELLGNPQKVNQLNNQSSRQKQLQRNEFSFSFKDMLGLGSSSSQAQRLGQRTQQRQIQEQRQREKWRLPFYKPSVAYKTTNGKIIKAEPGRYLVMVKRYGQFSIVSEAPTLQEAKRILSYNLQSSLAASGFIQQRGLNRKEDVSDLWGSTFTRAKKDPFTLVQKRGKRLSARSEVNEIWGLRGNRSNRKRNNKINWLVSPKPRKKSKRELDWWD